MKLKCRAVADSHVGAQVLFIGDIMERHGYGLHWPHGRGDQARIRANFGDEDAALIGRALTTGDTLADPVAARIAQGDGALAVQLRKGVQGGLDSVRGADPDLAALLSDIETAAARVPPDLLADGARGFWSMPPAVHIVSLSIGSLLQVYRSPSIAAVLSGTGRLVSGADARVRETAKWLGTAMLPGALAVGAPGYVATLGVRMLHARVRQYAARGGYDAAAWGAAINQVDLARTWMDFTRTAFQAEAAMGFFMTPEDERRLYALWQYLGHLLGVEARLIAGVTDSASAAARDRAFLAVGGPVTAQSRELARATIGSIALQLSEQVRLPKSVGRPLLHNLAHRLHGHDAAAALAIPPEAAMTPVVACAIRGIRARRSARLANPAAWRAATERHLGQLRHELAVFTDSAEYEGAV